MRKKGAFKKAYELGLLTNCEVQLLINTSKGLLYEYKSSGFDAKTKTVKRIAASHDETSMAQVSPLSIFDILNTAFQVHQALFYGFRLLKLLTVRSRTRRCLRCRKSHSLCTQKAPAPDFRKM